MQAFALWRELLSYARWAPSPHNIQPWRFKLVSQTKAIVFFDPTRLLPDTDPTGRFCWGGFGILFEELSIAAAPHGLEVAVSYLGEKLDARKPGLTPFAELNLVPRTAPEEFDRQLIPERRTSRLPYDDHPVSDVVLNDLRRIANQFGHEFEWSTKKDEVDWVVDLNADTMFYDMGEPLSRNEVGGWIRFSMKEARRKADGLAAYAMRFPGPMMWLFVHQNWIFRLPVVYSLVKALYLRSMKGTRTVGWLSGPFLNDNPQDWERSGRMLARFWLCMTKHGVYLHPFGSVITNAKAHARMDERFYSADRKHPLWLLVRLGHSDLPPQAQRLTVDQLLVQ